jgi:hypothetical protein
MKWPIITFILAVTVFDVSLMAKKGPEFCMFVGCFLHYYGVIK